MVARPDERLPDQVEAAAYFVVSECLANVDKHAQAGSATVSVTPVNGELVVSVGDDGVGGASTGDGSGLQGLEDRVGALDGTLAVESTPGEGTRVLARIPLEERVETLGFGPLPQPRADRRRGGPAPGPPPPRPARPRLRAGARRARDPRRLGAHGRAERLARLAAAGSGADRGARRLDACSASHRPGAPTSTARPDPRVLQRRRGVRATAGKLAIVNLFLVGIWIASGSHYFWPAWVMLGSALAVALKAVPWRHDWPQRVQGAP